MPFLKLGGKSYRFIKESLIESAYDEYLNNDYDVKKMTITNGSDKSCAILVRGNYVEDAGAKHFDSYKNLMYNDQIGAKVGGNTAPQFLLNRNNKQYGFIILNQYITFNYKYQVIERWGSPVYSGDRSKSTTTNLFFTSWSSRFPLENEYLCSFGKTSFSLKKGETSGFVDVGNSSYSENEPRNGLKCKIIIKASDAELIHCNNVGYDNWGSSVPDNVRDSLAFISTSQDKEHHGLFWAETTARRTITVTYLHQSAEYWTTVSNSKERHYSWFWRDPDYPEWWELRVSFVVPAARFAVDETKKFNKTYVYRAVRGVYGSGTESEEWRSYTYSTESGSSYKEDVATFCFSYDG